MCIWKKVTVIELDEVCWYPRLLNVTTRKGEVKVDLSGSFRTGSATVVLELAI